MSEPRTVERLGLVIFGISLFVVMVQAGTALPVCAGLAGPVVGALVERFRGGRGCLGAIAGGVLYYVGYGASAYTWHHFYPNPTTTDYLGPFLAFVVLAVLGFMVGTAVGLVFWLFSLSHEPASLKNQPK